MANPAAPEGSFISDVKELRRRAREHLEKGAVTQSYEGDLQRSIDLLEQHSRDRAGVACCVTSSTPPPLPGSTAKA